MFQKKQSWLQQKVSYMIKFAERSLASNQRRCIMCQKTQANPSDVPIQLAKSLQLCVMCQHNIPWIQNILCPTCGRYETCHDCKRRIQTFFVCNRSAVRYDSTMKEWLGQYKYRKNERLAQLFIAMLIPTMQHLIRELASQQQFIHCITFIPLSEQRMEERGFNQAEVLAQGLAQSSHIPILPLLTRHRHTFKQSYKSRAERLHDLEDAFLFDQTALVQHPDLFFNQTMSMPQPFNIVLVDDVFTTGSTLNQCAKMITSALPARIYGLTWAR